MFTSPVPGEAWCPLCKSAWQCGCLSFTSQLPKVTAQILPSALRGGDMTRRGDRPVRSSQLCSVHRRERVLEVLAVHVKITRVAFCCTFLPDGWRALIFVIHIQICDHFLFFFILLLRGLERISECQTQICSPGGSTQTRGMPELEGTLDIIWPD